MAENEEVNIITHLLEVEKEAYSLIAAANIKSEKIISEAKAKADVQFKSAYQEKAAEIEKAFSEKKEQISKDHDKIIDEYKNQVQEKTQDFSSLNKFLDKVIFEQA